MRMLASAGLCVGVGESRSEQMSYMAEKWGLVLPWR